MLILLFANKNLSRISHGKPFYTKPFYVIGVYKFSEVPYHNT